MSESATNTTTASSNTSQGARGAAGANQTPTRMAQEGKGVNGSNGPIPIKPDGDQSEPRKYKFEKLKIKGKEIDFEADEDEVKRLIQRGYGSNEAYHEAKRMREDAERKYAEYQKWQQSQEEHKKKITQNPIQAAIEAGASPQQVRDIAEKWLLEQIKADEMSPEAKRAKELEAELEKRDKADKERTQKEEQERLIQAAEEERKKIVPEFIKHMDAMGIPKTAANLSAAARRLKLAGERGVPMTIEKALQLTHEDNQAYVQGTVGGHAKLINEAYKSNDFDTVMKIGREIETFLGDEALVALQRYGIVKFKTKSPAMPHQVLDTAKTKAAPEEPLELTPDEIVEKRRQRALELDRMRGLRGAAPTL